MRWMWCDPPVFYVAYLFSFLLKEGHIHAMHFGDIWQLVSILASALAVVVFCLLGIPL